MKTFKCVGCGEEKSVHDKGERLNYLKCSCNRLMAPLKSETDSGATVPCSDGLCADVIEGSMEDLSFLIEMSETLKEGRHRNDSVRLDHVQQMIDDWIDQLKSA